MVAKTLFKRRADALRRELKRHRLDGLLVTDMANVTYLTGFTGSQGLALLTPRALFLIVDFRYFEQAALQAPFATLIHVQRALYDEAIAEAIGQASLSRVAFEADHASVATHMRWQALWPDTDWVPSRNLVEAAREVKDPEELMAIRRAAAITSAAVTGSLALLAPGITEREIAAEIERNFKRLGADGLAFEPLVACGERTALPHPQPGDRPLMPGDWLLIDAGCRVASYCADMTRTLVLGRTTARQREVWEAVRAALEVGLAAIRPGARAREVDAACRHELERRGFGAQFGHDTGHGVGLSLHEGPRLAADADDVLEAGMVVTVEPGVYVPGWGGARLEEMALVTATGAEVLTTAPLGLSPLSTLFT